MATAVALCGAVIVSQDGRGMVYRKKCESCGHVEPGTTSGSIPTGTLSSSFHCSRCRTRQEISIRGERTTGSPPPDDDDRRPSETGSRAGVGAFANRSPSPGGSFSGVSGGGTQGDTGLGDGVVGLFSLALALPGGAVSAVLGGVVCALIGVFTAKNPFQKDGIDGLFPSLFVLLFMLVFYGLIFAVGGAICGGVGGIVGYAVGRTTRQDVAARVSGAAGGVVLAVFVGAVLSAAELPCGTALTMLFLACGGCVGGVYWNRGSRYAETKVDTPTAQVAAPPPLPPAPSAPRWYYSRAGQTAGPVTVDEVRRLVASGQLQPTDFLLQEGTQTWVPVSTQAAVSHRSPG